MKVVNIQVLFPELKGGACYQKGRGAGSNVKSATKRAVEDMFKHMKVRKTFTKFSIEGQVRELEGENNGTGTVEVSARL